MHGILSSQLEGQFEEKLEVENGYSSSMLVKIYLRLRIHVNQHRKGRNLKLVCHQRKRNR